LTTVVQTTAQPDVAPLLTPALAAYRTATTRYLKTVNEAILASETIQLPLSTYQAQAALARQTNAALGDQLIEALDRRLAERAVTLTTQQLAVQAVVLLAGLLVTYLLIGFYQSVMNTVHALNNVALRMSRYDVPAHIELETHDELAQVVQSFNTVAGTLLGALTEQQQAVTHLRTAAAQLSRAAEEHNT
jgi:methyl-accepting chemotaxis protein